MDRATAAEADAVSDEGDVARRAREGDVEAYEELYRRHRDGVARAAYLVLGDSHRAQDVAQEAFLVGWRGLRKLREPAVFRAWITGIALNLCRRKALRRVLMERPLDERPSALTGGPDHLAVVVREAVRALPADMREVTVMRFYGEFTEREIAEALGVPAGTVKSRLSRARSRLTEALRPLVEEA